MSNTDWLSVREAAKVLGGVSVKTVYKLYHDQTIEGARIAGAVRLKTASVMAYLEAQSNKSKVAPCNLDSVPPATQRSVQSVPCGFRFLPR